MTSKKTAIALACVACCASLISVARFDAHIHHENAKAPSRKPIACAIQNEPVVEVTLSPIPLHLQMQTRFNADPMERAIHNPAWPWLQLLTQLNNDPEFDVQIDESLASTPAELKRLQGMASALSNFTGVPRDRTEYFSGVTGFYLECWCGIIHEISPISGGYRVTARVSPSLSETKGGIPVFVASDYHEVYDIINGVATHVKSLDPLGWSGESLMAVRL